MSFIRLEFNGDELSASEKLRIMERLNAESAFVPHYTFKLVEDEAEKTGGYFLDSSIADQISGIDSDDNDPVNNPKHYTEHPSGIECIQITEHMEFNLGNALKYIWRCDLKRDAIEDLKKAQWYIEREIAKREKV